MDRKDFISTLFPPALNKKKEVIAEEITRVPRKRHDQFFLNTIDPYTGPWTTNEVIHLLKRTQFGAPKEEVDYFSTLTYSAAVDLLLNTTNGNVTQPLKHYTSDPVNTPRTDADWGVSMGRPWPAAQSTDGTVNANRLVSLKCWWMDQMVNQSRGIEEKLILFWANHFSLEFATVAYGTIAYNYLKTIRTYCLGNFKQFVKAISIEPAMLIYLNGRYNTKTAPDENYGRELQELFTMGKGPNSQYTEADVQAAAKVLTGYTVNVSNSTYGFNSALHDTTNKQFSAFYNNTVITGLSGNAGATELDSLIDMLFANNELSMYIVRCIYRFFVYGSISPTIETNIITPLATTFRNNNFDIKPVLSQLFKSEHFFDVLTQGAMIKSPVDFIVGQAREFKLRFPPTSNTVLYYNMLNYLVGQTANMNQNPGDPPNVSGWPAYYQDPLYDEIWMDTDTYTKRLNFITSMLNGYTSSNQTMRLDWINFAKRMTNPSDPNQLVLDFNTYFLRVTLLQATRDTIKSQTLLTGQSTDGYWSSAWNTYVADPQNPLNVSNISGRLLNLAKFFLNVEEYHLM